MSRLVFLTCHLTGTGHFVRTLTLARAAQAARHEVAVVSGGRPLDHIDASDIDLIQLPPVTVKGFEFSVLREPGGAIASDAYMASRAEHLKAALHARPSDALVTELYPFGRRVLSAEFELAIAVARQLRPECAILSSVRDVPEPKPKRLEETADQIAANYDAVLVHGDAAVIPLTGIWPLPEPAKARLKYVGYLGPAFFKASRPRGDDVIVSVGGGTLGRALLDIAARAAALSQRPWRILVGGGDAIQVAHRLAREYPSDNLCIEPARPDYRDLLARAACSVSLCGYNTAVDLAQNTVPAVLVPSDEAGEQEQTIRAMSWAKHEGVEMMAMRDLTPRALAERVDARAMSGPRERLPIHVDQGERAVAAIEDVLAGKGTR